MKILSLQNLFVPARLLSLAVAASSFPLLSLGQVIDPNIVVTLPDLSMQPNTTTRFDLFVDNNGAARDVNGLAIYMEVEANGPSISDVDVLDQTIFGAVPNTGQNAPGTGSQGLPGFFYQETATASGTVQVAPGRTKFASVVFNSAGVTPDTYTYTLDTSLGLSFYTTSDEPFAPTILPGTLTVVPEPQSAALLFGLICAGAGAIYRIQRSRKPDQTAR